MMAHVLGAPGDARQAAWRVAVCALALVLLGLCVQISVQSPQALDGLAGFRKQAALVGAALFAGVLTFAFGYRRATRWSRPVLWASWALLAVLLLPGMPISKGASRWLVLGGISVQPSEVAKLTMILFLSSFAIAKGRRISEFREGFLPSVAYVAITAALVAAAPDLGQALFIVALSSAVLLVNGLRLRHFIPVIAFTIPLLVLFMSSQWGHVRQRLELFLSGGGGGFQVAQAQRYFALGGFDGTGLGHGRAHLWVPEIHNDFVLVAVGEQLGLLGSLLVLFLFLGLFYNGLRVAFLARDRLGFSVAFGISFMIALQATVNIAVVTGSVPPKGIGLPFVSSGGSSILVLGAALGLLVSVALSTQETEDPELVAPKDSSVPEGPARKIRASRARGPASIARLVNRATNVFDLDSSRHESRAPGSNPSIGLLTTGER